jgi:hypothetical protein
MPSWRFFQIKIWLEFPEHCEIKNLVNLQGEFGEFYKFCQGRQILSQDFILKNQQKPESKKSYDP